jgi:hypothetical protein
VFNRGVLITEPNVDIIIDCHDTDLLRDPWAGALG